MSSGTSAVDFDVYTKNDLCIINIVKDERFINDMLHKVTFSTTIFDRLY